MLPRLGTGAELRHAPLPSSSLRTLDIEARRQARRLRVSLPGPWKSQATDRHGNMDTPLALIRRHEGNRIR